MTITTGMTIALYTLNMLFALFILFISRKKASSVWAWLLVLFVFPILGFILYLLIGRNLRKKHFVRWNAVHQQETLTIYRLQKTALAEGTFDFPNEISKKHDRLVKMNLNYNHALFSSDNDIQFYSDGNDKFKAVIKDIQHATEYIHVQYYIFKMDGIGTEIVDALTERAKAGVEVKVLYDDLGSRKLHKKHFKQLLDAGGEVEAYFSSFLKMLNPRINYRNHRKMILIDGKIGFIGGFNVGDEYLGRDEKMGYWRDMHIRVEGKSIHSMQAHFLFDWHQARNEHMAIDERKYFKPINGSGNIPMQIVSSGPDTDHDSVKKMYIRMIASAKRYVYLQSPYFVPDEAFLEAIQIAASSGVDVRIMTPAVTDHMFVYGGNSAFGYDLKEYGGRIYRYEKGFLHTKMMVVDDEIATVGTANIDVRSFSLNFEINAIMYDASIAKHCRQIFEQDLKDSYEMTAERFEQRPLWTKIREGFSRLIAPLL